MSIPHLVLAFALAAGVIARAAGEPDHLVPVDPYPDEEGWRYSEQLRSRFGLASFFFAQMVVRPSFSGEYAVRLHGATNDNQFETTHQFFLTSAAADKSIWYSMRRNNDNKTEPKVSIAITTVEVPRPLAERILQLWQRMLLRTRYPEEGAGGLDGVTFEFGIWCAYGEAWSPEERKSPLLFIELGESLIAYCKAAPAKRPAAAKEIEIKAAQLEKYLDEHPSK